MSTDASPPVQTLAETLTSLPGCYAVPIRCSYGTAAEINFWDVIYLRAHEAGGVFDTSTEELSDQMGLARQTCSQLRREAIEWGELIEDISWVSGRRFLLRVPDFPLAKGVIWKPLGYIRNGWHRVVTPAIPKRVLNLYLQLPRQRVYHLDPAYVAAKCKRRFYGESHPAAPLNSADVGKALRLLARLGLISPEGDGFRLDWASFNRPAPTLAPLFDAPDPREHSLFREMAAIAPARAERALELLDVGGYELETHFSDIFRDLAYVRDEDYATLKAKVYRHRNRPPSPHRWRDTWKAFQYELKRRIAEVRTSKAILNLGEAASATCTLGLDAGPAPRPVLAVRVVSRVEWPWYLEGQAAVQLELRAGHRVLFARAIGPGDAEVRYSLPQSEWPTPTAPLTLEAQCDRPLPGLCVEAWLEARLKR